MKIPPTARKVRCSEPSFYKRLYLIVISIFCKEDVLEIFASFYNPFSVVVLVFIIELMPLKF